MVNNFLRNIYLQANLTIQEAKLNVAQNDLNVAQAQLDAKQAELDKVQALYDRAVQEKQVILVEDTGEVSSNREGNFHHFW